MKTTAGPDIVRTCRSFYVFLYFRFYLRIYIDRENNLQ